MVGSSSARKRRGRPWEPKGRMEEEEAVLEAAENPDMLEVK